MTKLTTLKLVKFPFQKYDELFEKCQDIRSQVDNSQLVSLHQGMQSAPKVTQPYTFTHHVTLHGNLTVQGPSLASNVREVMCWEIFAYLSLTCNLLFLSLVELVIYMIQWWCYKWLKIRLGKKQIQLNFNIEWLVRYILLK